MKKLLWLDLETTGLDPLHNAILEVFAGVADYDRPFEITPLIDTSIAFEIDIDERIDPFVLDMHSKNGLWADCARSNVTTHDVQRELLRHVPKLPQEQSADRWILAGSTVHFDLGFLRFDMPDLARRLSHRCYDVSAVKMFCESLGMPPLPKAEAHRAKADVEESIAHAFECARWIKRGQL